MWTGLAACGQRWGYLAAVYDTLGLTTTLPLMPRFRNALLLVCVLNCTTMAQSTSVLAPDKPSPPHELLRFFEGTWTTTDSTAEDGFREVCAWMPEGRRHMVCRSRWTTTSGPREGMSVFSFDSKTGRYVYTGFRSGGAVVVQYGQEQGGRWLFTSEEGAGAARIRTRVTIEANTDHGFDLTSERSVGDGPWSQPSKVSYRRVGQ